MPHAIYHFGYTGRDFNDITSRVVQSRAILVDIRYSPRSRVPQWSVKSFDRTLGAQYCWLGDTLGNRDYRRGGIDIVDLPRGLDTIARMAERRPVVLMCVCSKANACHRKPIVGALTDAGFDVIDGLPEPGRSL